MKLTDEEKRMLDGESGEATRHSMEMLVKLGDMYEAERLVEITSAHVSISYSEFLASVELIESFANKGGKFSVPATVNPGHWKSNFNRWPDLPEPAEHLKRAQRMLDAIDRLGAIQTCSCIPYFQGNLPRYGQNVAWIESSAISFAPKKSVPNGRWGPCSSIGLTGKKKIVLFLSSLPISSQVILSS